MAKEHPPLGTPSPGYWGGSSRQSYGARSVARSGPGPRHFFPSDSLAPWQGKDFMEFYQNSGISHGYAKDMIDLILPYHDNRGIEEFSAA